MQITESTIADLKITDRIRWSKSGDQRGPVLVLFVGIHGNEPAGLKAIENLSKQIDESATPFRGSVYAISGNLQAINLGLRYLDTDLNRLWELYNTSEDFSQMNGQDWPAEYDESLDIKKAIDAIVEKHSQQADDFIFADLHTTSSESCAFILLNDTLANRGLARKFPVPQILGIEENIHGTLLSYINNLGYKAIGFEAGAHQNEASVERSEAFLWLLLHFTGALKLERKKVNEFKEKLGAHPGVPETYYEIKFHQFVNDPQDFDMLSGFENFDLIEKDAPLAYYKGELINAPVSGRIFMPLYQKKGHDGFLIIREVSDFWLRLSAYLRKSFVHKYLKYLPGVTPAGNRGFEVDLRIARFLVEDIFHLLGYRVTKKDENTLICYRR